MSIEAARPAAPARAVIVACAAKRALIIGLFAAASALAGPEEAVAQCAGVPGSGTITCASDDPNGLADGESNAGDAVVVAPGVVIGDTINIDDDDQSVFNDGVVDGAPAGVNTGGDDVTVSNSGSITGSSDGVDNQGETFTLDNFGSIVGTGANGVETDGTTVVNNAAGALIEGGSNGIETSGGVDLTVNNDGVIRGSDGIDGSASGVITLLNNGFVDASDEGLDDVAVGSVIRNFGTIIGSGDDGIETDGSGAGLITIFNHGLIQGGSDGIELDHTVGDTFIVNTGKIIGVGTEAIDGNGSNAGDITIINSGLIRGDVADASEEAIRFGAGDDRLVLAPGSKILGELDFNGGVDTLEIGGGVDAVLEFGGGGDDAPEIILGDGAPFVVSGDLFATFDTTIFTAQIDQFADFTGALSRSLRQRGTGGVSAAPEQVLTFAALAGVDRPQALAQAPVSRIGATAVWVDVFGGVRERRADGARNEIESAWFGGMAGLDVYENDGYRLGVFAGAAGGGASTLVDVAASHSHPETQDLDVISGFGGVYAGKTYGRFALNGSVAAGYSAYDSTREVADLTGDVSAEADFGAVFVAPEITGATVVPIHEKVSLEPSLTLGYAGLFVEDYVETGSTAPASVDARTAHLLRGRAQLAAAVLANRSDLGDVVITPRVALDGHASFGDDVTGALLGQAVSLQPSDDDDRVQILGGASFSFERAAGGISVFLDAEGGRDFDGGSTVNARAGLRIPLN